MLKKAQYKCIVSDIDNLLDFKVDFNKKANFFHKQVEDLTKLCNLKTVELIKNFETVKDPILNKV